MEQKTALPENLCADEAVCIPLEANEVEILKGLSGMIRNDRTTEIKTR